MLKTSLSTVLLGVIAVLLAMIALIKTAPNVEAQGGTEYYIVSYGQPGVSARYIDMSQQISNTAASLNGKVHSIENIGGTPWHVLFEVPKGTIARMKAAAASNAGK